MLITQQSKPTPLHRTAAFCWVPLYNCGVRVYYVRNRTCRPTLHGILKLVSRRKHTAVDLNDPLKPFYCKTNDIWPLETIATNGQGIQKPLTILISMVRVPKNSMVMVSSKTIENCNGLSKTNDNFKWCPREVQFAVLNYSLFDSYFVCAWRSGDGKTGRRLTLHGRQGDRIGVGRAFIWADADSLLHSLCLSPDLSIYLICIDIFDSHAFVKFVNS